MRACAAANAVILGLAIAVASIVACSSSQVTSPPAGFDATVLPPTTMPPPTTPTRSAAQPTSASTATTPPPTVNVAVPAAPPRSDITNEPDGGVVLNNAMTAADAGASDRLQPILDLIKANRDGFRRCFDARSGTSAATQGRVLMIVELAPDGALKSASIDGAKSAFRASDVEACMVAFAKTLAYPKSPSGKVTRITYPFDFKAR